ncbi:type II secretion system F family protein [Frankia sp. CNm7]|uniref:Type II secretion system F family protein n=1 Tax=Frankia nepalensis TaxID=1836974 RepID=A0A937UN62_9ACTN|nr:type II secretion system F family protein [Frankia nepalensis]MBL7499127.1 type II secretion system F family protein [Frankia nepalensis]MBL7515157.1 type II secretion system F family protein [Frankia nepalensis]MBL7524378.1 type II secretion system F family protein [Frankia nepalensis]MBL7625920.1 type II secretion system F family protein [Frankia nepalensis]
MSLAAAGALLGLLLGVGLVTIAVRSPRARRIRYADRVDPYLRDTPSPSRLLDERERRQHRGAGRAPTPLAAVEALARPFLDDAARRLDRFLGGRAGLTRRLTQAGGRTSVEEFRAGQVIWAAAGGLLGALVLVLRAVTGLGPPPAVGVALIVAGVAGGVVAREWRLTRAIREREDRMLMEFPTVAELLALAVTAGESPVGALERVARLTHGELGHELRLALADARAGATLVQALEGIATRTTLASLARFVDGMAVAIERGTPLADVLRAQAVDVREAGRRQLLEAGGRKEIAMMVPVVFLVLPTTVIFAFYPALVSFTFFAQ